MQDESRIGRKTESRRVITAKGVKPKIAVEWPREAFWLYGVVAPMEGWSWTQRYQKLNQVSFQEFLNALSQELADCVAVMQLDQAPAHKGQQIEWPENIIPLFQPPHCPELNPIERFWQHLKGKWKGESFESLRQLEKRVEEELTKMSAQEVQSLTSYPFIVEALIALEQEGAA